MKIHVPVIPSTPKRYPNGRDVALIFPDQVKFDYWDLWCLICAQEKFSGNLLELKKHIIELRLNDQYGGFSVREHLEDMIALLDDLESRIAMPASVNSILSKLPERFYSKERQKAEKNIIKGYGSYRPSEAMLKSPRRLLQKEAMRGMWKKLPIDPTPIANHLRKLFIPKKDKGFFPKGTTFALSKRIDSAVKKKLQNDDPIFNHAGYRYAVYRAALTLYQEENSWDDSYGEMGRLGQEWMKEVLCFTAAHIGSPADVFLKDLLMFLVWEDYGLVSSGQVGSYIQNLGVNEKELSTFLLRNIQVRASKGFQQYRAEQVQKFYLLFL